MSTNDRLRGGKAFIEAVVHEESPLTAKARLVAVTLDAYSHPKTGAVVMPGSVISERTGLSARGVDRAVAELDDHGFLQVRKRRHKKAARPFNEYRARVPVPFDWSVVPGSPVCGLVSRQARRVLLPGQSWQGAVATMGALCFVDRDGVVHGSYADMASVAGCARRSMISWMRVAELMRERPSCGEFSTARWRVSPAVWPAVGLGSYWPEEGP